MGSKTAYSTYKYRVLQQPYVGHFYYYIIKYLCFFSSSSAPFLMHPPSICLSLHISLPTLVPGFTSFLQVLLPPSKIHASLQLHLKHFASQTVGTEVEQTSPGPCNLYRLFVSMYSSHLMNPLYCNLILKMDLYTASHKRQSLSQVGLGKIH